MTFVIEVADGYTRDPHRQGRRQLRRREESAEKRKREDGNTRESEFHITDSEGGILKVKVAPHIDRNYTLLHQMKEGESIVG